MYSAGYNKFYRRQHSLDQTGLLRIKQPNAIRVVRQARPGFLKDDLIGRDSVRRS